MKKITLTFLGACLCLSTIAQINLANNKKCDFTINPSFKSGVDTVVIIAEYRAFFRGNQFYLLKLLADKKEIKLDEYENENRQGESLSFMPLGCATLFQARLSRKIYDKGYISKNKANDEPSQTLVNLNSLREGQKISLKCIVFSQQNVRDTDGSYFFTIIGLKIYE